MSRNSSGPFMGSAAKTRQATISSGTIQGSYDSDDRFSRLQPGPLPRRHKLCLKCLGSGKGLPGRAFSVAADKELRWQTSPVEPATSKVSNGVSLKMTSSAASSPPEAAADSSTRRSDTLCTTAPKARRALLSPLPPSWRWLRYSSGSPKIRRAKVAPPAGDQNTHQNLILTSIAAGITNFR